MNDDRGQDAAAAEAEAASWLVRLQSRPDAETHAAFEAWLSGAPERAAAWAKVNGAWARLGGMKDAPEIAAARAGLRAELSAARRGALPRWASAAAAAVVLSIAGVLGYGAWAPAHRDASSPAEVGGVVYRTAVGGRQTVTLADGSVLVLNTDSQVRVAPFGTQRAVELVRGETYFQVAKDPGRPFIVTAPGGTVTALGTAFSVRSEPQRWSVSLVEGRVRVRGDGAAVELAPGDQLLQEGRNPWRIVRTDVSEMAPWRDGRLVFHDRPLAEIVGEMNRYSRIKLTIADPRLAAAPLSGRFRTGDVEGFVESLEAYGLARAERRSATAIELHAPAG
ncbi:FecR domain-containing protein [Phenylobacterium sp.]|uniref:FecR family protein n=1 Tax=Phenylobacterium sp. TaxID=1871053 RepID=UPI0035AFCD9D